MSPIATTLLILGLAVLALLSNRSAAGGRGHRCLGLLAILTIGLPILLAGVLCLAAAVRQRPTIT